MSVAPRFRPSYSSSSSQSTIAEPGTTTTPKETARDQFRAMAAGAHPRCGARCPLWLMVARYNNSSSTIMGGGGGGGRPGEDGTLALRLVWAWIVETSRFYCLRLWGETGTGYGFVVALRVSPLLLALTHKMWWWAGLSGPREIVGANQDYLVVARVATERRAREIYLQDRATGERVKMLPSFGGDYSRRPKCLDATNGKWFVVCDSGRGEMTVVEVPRKGCSATGERASEPTRIRKPTVVSLRARWKKGRPEFVCGHEDQVVLHCCDLQRPARFFELVLVDVAQTCSSNKLVVLSATVPRLIDLPPDIRRYDRYDLFIGRRCFAFLKENGCRCFVMLESQVLRGILPFVIMDEGTGKLQPMSPGPKPDSWGGDWCVSWLNNSQFCVFKGSKGHYEVWGVNDSTKPVRTQRCLCCWAATSAFVEGGLLFQMSEGEKEMHVTEESTGSHVVTFQSFRKLRPDLLETHHSFPLSCP